MFSNYTIQDALCQNLVSEISFEQLEIFEIISKIFLNPNFSRNTVFLNIFWQHPCELTWHLLSLHDISCVNNYQSGVL